MKNQMLFTQLSGLCFTLSGMFTLFGIIISESLTPEYSTRLNTISDLGTINNLSAIPLHSIVFTIAILLSGISLLFAARFSKFHHSMASSILLTIYGVSIVGVGLFSNALYVPHLVSAITNFVCGALCAIHIGLYEEGGLRYVSLFLGVVSFLSLFGFYWLTRYFGVGGAERLIVYPITVWLILYGGYRMNTYNKTV